MDRPYLSLTGRVRRETAKVKGSRFIATAIPVSGDADLGALVEELRREFPDANHHCWAWRRGESFRWNDDGEPSGSAGRPILQQIDGRGVDRVGLVVSRIFGGTKLGVGGLMRAYGGAARELLEHAAIVEVVPTTRVTVTLPYELAGAVVALGREFALAPAESSFGETVRHVFDVPCARAQEFAREAVERTAGRARVKTGTA